MEFNHKTDFLLINVCYSAILSESVVYCKSRGSNYHIDDDADRSKFFIWGGRGTGISAPGKKGTK